MLNLLNFHARIYFQATTLTKSQLHKLPEFMKYSLLYLNAIY